MPFSRGNHPSLRCLVASITAPPTASSRRRRPPSLPRHRPPPPPPTEEKKEINKTKKGRKIDEERGIVASAFRRRTRACPSLARSRRSSRALAAAAVGVSLRCGRLGIDFFPFPLGPGKGIQLQCMLLMICHSNPLRSVISEDRRGILAGVSFRRRMVQH